MSRTRIKICGIRDVEAARAAVESGVDALGFMFVKSSPRYIVPESAWEILSALPPMVSTVGVFADAPVDQFCDIEEMCPTNYVQLHGQEPESVVKRCGPNVIKGVRFDAATIEEELRRWEAVEEVEAVLVDGSAGGQGTAFDWTALAPLADRAQVPIILAGGLTAENVGEAIRAVRPFAVDVSSGVEREKGVKDADLIGAFCDAVREADRG
ncbi:MAG: phosphoribosylanthranilate isomerase [Phycisphaerales bacterium]|nr:phosphoribosylanthranilate isomerase [Phycisphaerales bacterium]